MTDLERRSLTILSTLKSHMGRATYPDELCLGCDGDIEKLIEDLQVEALKE